ncbi:MAG: hypothetical protein KDD92_09800 [Caldilineaceae bacterium]|nr:hypothetical protein [Caldilineaceae bacterium]
MQATMYLEGKDKPVSVLDEVNVVEMNDNHTASPMRILYKSRQLNASKVMTELFRDQKMKLELEDGRTCQVVLQHSSLDSAGNAVGVLRVLDALTAPAGA